VQQAAAAALKAAKSVHVRGTALNQGKPLQADLRIQGNASSGTMEMQGVKTEIITIGSTTFLKTDQQTWKVLRVPAAAAQLLAGRWVKTRPEQVTGVTGFSLDNLAAQLVKNDSPWESKVEQTTLGGNKVVVLSQQDGSKLYVANTGPPYPLRGEEKGSNAAGPTSPSTVPTSTSPHPATPWTSARPGSRSTRSSAGYQNLSLMGVKGTTTVVPVVLTNPAYKGQASGRLRTTRGPAAPVGAGAGRLGHAHSGASTPP